MAIDDVLTCRKQAQIFRNITAVLEAAGSSLEKLLKVNIFLTNMDDFAAVNEVYAQVLNFEPKPVNDDLISPASSIRCFRFLSFLFRAACLDATGHSLTPSTQVRTCVAVKTLPRNTDVEIECSAYI